MSVRAYDLMTHYKNYKLDNMKSTLVKSSLIIPALGLFVLGGVVTSSAFAHDGDGERNGPRAFFASQDLTDEQRAAVEEARELRQTGDKEGARAIIENAGIELPERPDKGERSEKREAVRAAVDANDYDAFVAATLDAPFADQVTETFFASFVEAHELREAGDKEGAREILEGLGLKPHHKHTQGE